MHCALAQEDVKRLHVQVSQQPERALLRLMTPVIRISRIPSHGAVAARDAIEFVIGEFLASGLTIIFYKHSLEVARREARRAAQQNVGNRPRSVI